jgi:hypothetical protein
MSMEFSVVLRKKVDLTALKYGAKAVLKEVLNLSSDPNIEIKKMKLTQNSISEVGDTVTIKIDALAEANITVMDLPNNETEPFSKEMTAVISAGSLRTEESWALVIALAIALGKAINANVIDDSLLLSSISENSPTQLLERLKIAEEQDNLSQASHEFLKSLGLI